MSGTPSGTPSGDGITGRVLEWHGEEGWGVLVSDALPDRVWAHFSVILADGFRELTAGQCVTFSGVTFSAEETEQDGFRRRAVRVRPRSGGPAGPHRRTHEETGPGYSSALDITFDP
ncbi:cold-shock protein [Streptomyces sp. HMX87]|uniref:cold-shock protein n=1 Tax=Streptomyces sp. HMX87 TaxID=3390849 RepID=UPI003A87C429